MDLNNFIYDFNLASTKTVTDKFEICNSINNGRKVLIDYSESINFIDLVTKFNDAYQEFKPNLKQLKPFLKMLGSKVTFAYFINEKDFIDLALSVDKPNPNIFNDTWAAIHILQIDNSYIVRADNNLRISDSNRKVIDITNKLDKELDSFLPLIKDYYLLFNAYEKIKNATLFNINVPEISTKISGDIFKYLRTFTLKIGNFFLDSTDYLEIKFKLGKNLEIMYDQSEVMFKDTTIQDKDIKIAIINNLIKELYINKSFLPDMYNESEVTRKLIK